MLWIGDRLGAVERACMLSVLRQGHALALYCYTVPEGVPAGVNLRDAAEILPKTSIIRHQSGSVGLFANRFRYELMRRGLGTWLDCDMYLCGPIDDDAPSLYGEQEPGIINNAVLRLPPDSPLLPPLLALFDERQVPPWLPFRARMAARWRLLTRGRSGLAKMPWGSAGPNALSFLAREQGLDGFALPRHIFYPVHWRQADWILDPAVRLQDVTAPGTIGVHLWNERIRSFKDAPAPPGSFLARLQQEGSR